MPICLLEVNTSTTHILSPFQYEIYNTSVLKFAYGDEIKLTCKPGYKASEPTVKMLCKPDHNGTWSRKLPSICRGTCIYWALMIYILAKYITAKIHVFIAPAAYSFLMFYCSQKFFVRILL